MHGAVQCSAVRAVHCSNTVNCADQYMLTGGDGGMHPTGSCSYRGAAITNYTEGIDKRTTVTACNSSKYSAGYQHIPYCGSETHLQLWDYPMVAFVGSTDK